MFHGWRRRNACPVSSSDRPIFFPTHTQSLEKFSHLTHQVSCSLDAFMRVIHDTEFPNSVEATQRLLDRQGGEYEGLKEDILSAARHGDRLLEDFRAKDDVGKEFSERNGNVSSTER